MSAFVRKNALVVSATFTATDGTTTQPSVVTCVLVYKNQSGNTQTATFALTYQAPTNKWVGLWDSSVAGKGTVSYLIYGVGSLQAAFEGWFEILANAANTV